MSPLFSRRATSYRVLLASTDTCVFDFGNPDASPKHGVHRWRVFEEDYRCILARDEHRLFAEQPLTGDQRRGRIGEQVGFAEVVQRHLDGARLVTEARRTHAL